jgi:NAD(P)H-dependent FMN reductase
MLWVMPEYNHGYTAPLKNAIDYLVHEWAWKPVLSNLKMVPMADSVAIRGSPSW